ncbi:hypothetical protein AV929_11850 [Haloarcula sp. K1]|nr:hypothetical protein AV929_11850 [Haloarcula sp. K1]
MPDKNLRELGGKPLIAHSIEQAQSATHIDRSIVSTEDPRIRRKAEEFGASVPFQRPDEIATDTSTANEVVQHAIKWYKSNNETFEYVCLLLPTVPFRTVEDIDTAVNHLQESDAHSLVSVTQYDNPPFWAVETNQERILPHFDENPWQKTRTQEFPTLYHPNGAVYVASVADFEAAESFYTDKTIHYKMPKERSLDIDEPYDLEKARALLAWRSE